MNTSLIHLNKPQSKSSNAAKAAEAFKAIVFSIGNLSLALPIQKIYKILGQTVVYGSGLNHLGITLLGEREVTVIDLNRNLFSGITEQVTKVSYLVITQTSQAELYGIPVIKVPVMIDIPLSSLRVLPESYRQSDLLGIASHVCQIPQKEENLTLFLLDVDKIGEFCH